MTGPISPSDVTAKKTASIPAGVFEVFNECITKNFSGRSATVTQKQVVAAILSRMSLPDSAKIFDEHWLDVEDAYREKGWEVEYDKPGYNKTYEAYFVFTAPRNGK